MHSRAVTGAGAGAVSRAVTAALTGPQRAPNGAAIVAANGAPIHESCADYDTGAVTGGLGGAGGLPCHHFLSSPSVTPTPRPTDSVAHEQIDV